MIRSLSSFLLILAISVAAVSCNTYLIPVESFKEQFMKYDTADMREVSTQDPYGGIERYKSYPIDTIRVVDKKGNPAFLVNGPAIEVRMTDSFNKKRIFYFDLMCFQNDTILVRPSRFLKGMERKIPINAVKKIEVQDGKKKYKYIK